MSKRTIIIGDVHGCLIELEKLLTKVKYKGENDRLIFVGDLVNKGPDSIGVLKLVKSLDAEVVMGNHDLAVLNNTKKGKKLVQEMGDDYPYWAEYISTFKPFIEADDFIVVHAGLVPNQHPSESDIVDLTQIRTWDGVGEDLQDKTNPAWYEFYTGEKLVVFGHWARLGLMQSQKAICLDSRCVYGGKLSTLILPERELIQVDAEQAYSKV